MQAKRINVDTLTVPEILSIVEIFNDFWLRRVDWGRLKRQLASQISWLLLDGDTIVGCVMFRNARSFMNGAFLLTEFVYRWDYSSENRILEMLQTITDVCLPNAVCLLMDVNRVHDFNFPIYRRFGFQQACTPSRNGSDYMIMIKDLNP